MALIFTIARHRGYKGTRYGPELFQHVRLNGIFPAVVLEEELLFGETSDSGAEIDIRLTGYNVQP